MPLKSGKSQKTISSNISEFHGGKTFKKTAAKFGKKKANDQAVAVAMDKARESGGGKLPMKETPTGTVTKQAFGGKKKEKQGK